MDPQDLVSSLNAQAVTDDVVFSSRGAFDVTNVVKQGKAWTVIDDYGELIRHPRVAAVHRTQAAAVGVRLAPILSDVRAARPNAH